MQHHENPYAGQGPVLLDIGGDVGALVVAMPPETEGLEVEIRPLGATATRQGREGPGHHAHDHHDHDHHDHDHHPHVGVVARPGTDGPAHSLVYPEVTQGTYELVPIPGDTVAMRAEVVGGTVTHLAWPADLPT